MTKKPVCFLSYATFGEVDERAVKRAASLGCTGLIVEQVHRVAQTPDDLTAAAKASRAASLTLVARIDLRRFPVDHRAVVASPHDFTVQRNAGTGPVDPRNPMPSTGEALARLGDPEVAHRLQGTIVKTLGELTKAGITGVCLVDADRLPPSLVEAVTGQTAGSDTLLLLETANGRQTSGVDYLVSPSSTSPCAGNSAATLVSLKGEPTDAALKLAALTGAGFIAPADTGDAALRAAIAQPPLPPHASLHEIPGAGKNLYVALRTPEADLRYARQGELIVANLTDQPREVTLGAGLGQQAAPFLGDVKIPALAPFEVRTIEVSRGEPILRPASAGSTANPSSPRLVVEEVSPTVDGGAFPIKRVVGDTVEVEATIFADGHEQLAAELRWRAQDTDEWNATRMEPLANDRWSAQFTLERMGRHEFVVEGWLDRFGGYQRDFRKKVDAKVEQPVDHLEGRQLIGEAIARSKGKLATALKKHLAASETADDAGSIATLLSPELRALMDQADDRRHALTSVAFPVDAERIEARFSSWYELFPRSMGPIPAPGEKPRHGTFADVVEHLPRIREMGFDTLYFPPIHPIGTKNRKGPNNTLTPGPDDTGSPYAIGSEDGGHDAIHPELGTFEDFDRLVQSAAEHGLEIALDFAINASPDHPWLEEHPGWFAWLPDGGMKYAENPPKKYQDIVNVDFYAPDAVPGLWEGLRDVILLWVSHGVKTFRVDNPHTKPLPFWEWMIGEVRARHPEVIFLSEAFTRPTLMYRLAKVGFSQSYTYFTWRDTKHELTEYITELTDEAPKDFYRPHFFVNTPDINPFFLQTGGRPAHRIRAVLAATLSGLWGVYSGFELCDAAPLGPGKEEYLDSEKYEMRPREWRQPGDIVDDVTLLNRLRRANPALQTHLNTRFYEAHDDSIIWYGRPLLRADGTLRDLIMVMVNMDPHNPHSCDFEVPLWEFGLDDDAGMAVEDLAAGHRFTWHGKAQHIELSPDEPYRIWRLSPAGANA